MGSFFGGLSGENLSGQFDEMRKVVATNIARSVYGETGPVTDVDIERIAASLPSRFETETKAGQKYSRLYANLQGGINDVTQMAGGGDTNMLATNPTYYPESTLSPTNVSAGGLSDQEIPVEDLQSGMRGWVNQSEFDPTRYRKL